MFKVSEECIGCRACVEIAGENFDINDSNIAYLKKQPDNEDEEVLCEEAMETCPVNAIFKENLKLEDETPIIASSNVKETLDKYPELKDALINLSPKFKRFQNPILYNTLARFASFKDAARTTGVSICEILHTLNKHLGMENKLLKSMPECINQKDDTFVIKSEPITWQESQERFIYNFDTMTELVTKITALHPQENIVIIAVQRPDELMKVAEGLGFKYNLDENRDFRLSVFNPSPKEKSVPWEERKDEFEILDVRRMKTDPFDIIIKKAYEVEEDDEFILIQKFEPIPMINMLSEMGFESLTVNKDFMEVWIYFHKKVTSEEDKAAAADKPSVVIQSATPVAYPVIMRLLQSEKIRKAVNIKELKVWEETEKHLGWIVNGRADISFSALITLAKLRNSDVKIPSLFVWDNFVILTRYKAESLKDIRGREIYTPLFEEAPPAKITKYLIKACGLDENDFKFVYGEPFGRPEQIYADFVSGKADTVVLREPEASYAIKIMQDRKETISVISYNKIWNEVNEGFGSFPNAGVVLKGEFVRKYPEITKVFLEELKSAINWVNNNKKASANLSFDLMRQPVDRIELFLDRVNFNYVEGDELVEKVKQYFGILIENDIVTTQIDDQFLEIFKI